MASRSTPTTASPTSRRGCCGFSTSAPSSTIRPGRSGRLATPRASDSPWSRRPSGCCSATDLATLSDERRGAELARLAAEPSGPAGLGLLAEWGLIELRPGGAELAETVAELLGDEPWREEAPHAEAVLVAALGPATAAEEELAAAHPARPSEGYELASGRDPVDLVVARARGAAWLDDHLREWRPVALEIDGGALIAAGVPEGPALGRALRAARRAVLDGEARGREEELAIALAAARQG